MAYANTSASASVTKKMRSVGRLGDVATPAVAILLKIHHLEPLLHDKAGVVVLPRLDVDDGKPVDVAQPRVPESRSCPRNRRTHAVVESADTTLHRLLVHMLAETARHAGHMDGLREPS